MVDISIVTYYLYPLQNRVIVGYTVFSMSVIQKFRDSILLSTFKFFCQ